MCTSPASPELSRQEQLGCQFDGNVHLPHPSSSPSSQSPSLQSVLPSIKPRHCYTTHSTHDCLLRGPRCGLSNDGAGRTGPDSPHECVTCHSLLRFSGVTDSTRLDSARKRARVLTSFPGATSYPLENSALTEEDPYIGPWAFRSISSPGKLPKTMFGLFWLSSFSGPINLSPTSWSIRRPTTMPRFARTA